MQKFTELEVRVAALEELLTKPKGIENDDNENSEGQIKTGQGSGTVESVPKETQGGKA